MDKADNAMRQNLSASMQAICTMSLPEDTLLENLISATDRTLHLRRKGDKVASDSNVYYMRAHMDWPFVERKPYQEKPRKAKPLNASDLLNTVLTLVMITSCYEIFWLFQTCIAKANTSHAGSLPQCTWRETFKRPRLIDWPPVFRKDVSRFQ